MDLTPKLIEAGFKQFSCNGCNEVVTTNEKANIAVSKCHSCREKEAGRRLLAEEVAI